MAQAKPLHTWLAAEVAAEVANRLGWPDQLREQFLNCCINGRMVSKKSEEQLKCDHLGAFPQADDAIKILTQLKAGGAAAASSPAPHPSVAVAVPAAATATATAVATVVTAAPAPTAPAAAAAAAAGAGAAASTPVAVSASATAAVSTPVATSIVTAAAATLAVTFSFDQIDRALALKWKSELVKENGEAKLPTEKVDEAGNRMESDEHFHGFMLPPFLEASAWRYPDGFIPSIGNGSNIVAASIHPHDVDDLDVIYDFIIRVCVYLSGIPSHLTEVLKRVAQSLPQKTREDIMTWLNFDALNENTNCVGKVLLNKEFLAALSPEQQNICRDCYKSIKGYLKEYAFKGIFTKPQPGENPWRQRVTVPLFDIGTEDADDDEKPRCGWLSTERFIAIFGGAYLQLIGAEVRLLPPWDVPVFNEPDFIHCLFLGSAEYSPAIDSLDPVFSWLFRRSLDAERRNTVRATTLAFFKPPAPAQEIPDQELVAEALQQSCLSETALADDHVVTSDAANPNIDRHTFNKSGSDGIVGTFTFCALVVCLPIFLSLECSDLSTRVIFISCCTPTFLQSSICGTLADVHLQPHRTVITLSTNECRLLRELQLPYQKRTCAT
jgi:hypothetical protein